jgi:hypothetical protein
LTVAVPTALPVKETEQLPPERVQLVALRDPDPVEDSETVPVGVIAVPELEVSVAVTVHVAGWPMAIGLLQETVTAEVLLLELIVAGLAVELPP